MAKFILCISIYCSNPATGHFYLHLAEKIESGDQSMIFFFIAIRHGIFLSICILIYFLSFFSCNFCILHDKEKKNSNDETSLLYHFWFLSKSPSFLSIRKLNKNTFFFFLNYNAVYIKMQTSLLLDLF